MSGLRFFLNEMEEKFSFEWNSPSSSFRHLVSHVDIGVCGCIWVCCNCIWDWCCCCFCCRCLAKRVGLGELNIGGGGIGPISLSGIGGSGSSERTRVLLWCGKGVMYRSIVCCLSPGICIPPFRLVIILEGSRVFGRLGFCCSPDGGPPPPDPWFPVEPPFPPPPVESPCPDKAPFPLCCWCCSVFSFFGSVKHLKID